MLLKTIEEFKKYVAVNFGLEIESLEGYIQEAERQHLVPVLGQVEYDALVAAYVADPQTLTPAQEALLPHVQRMLAGFAYLAYLPIGNVQVSDAGIHRTENDHQKSAWQWQVRELRTSIGESAFRALEALLGFLWAHPADYPDWNGSAEKAHYLRHFLNTSREFSRHFDLQDSARLYFRLRPTLQTVEEFRIRPILGKTLYNTLKAEIAALNLSPESEALLEQIRPALAHLTVHQALSRRAISLTDFGASEQEVRTNDNGFGISPARDGVVSHFLSEAEANGEAYLHELEAYLDEHHATYPDYPYEAPVEGENEWNTAESSGFIF